MQGTSLLAYCSSETDTASRTKRLQFSFEGVVFILQQEQHILRAATPHQAVSHLKSSHWARKGTHRS